MKKYFLQVNGYTVGPYSFEELRMMNISPYTPVWFQGLTYWTTANQVAELQSLFFANPQPFYQQPASVSPYATQPNYPVNPPSNKNSNAKIFIIVGSLFLLLLAIGIFLAYSYREKRRRDMEIIERMSDSIQAADSLNAVVEAVTADSAHIADSIQAVEGLKASFGSSQYAGSYSNSSGGTLSVKGDDDNDLQITLNFQSTSGDCSGEIFGTGKATQTGKVIMKTNDGCKLTLDFSETFVDVEESISCKSYHGTNCTFEGFYFKE